MPYVLHVQYICSGNNRRKNSITLEMFCIKATNEFNLKKKITQNTALTRSICIFYGNENSFMNTEQRTITTQINAFQLITVKFSVFNVCLFSHHFAKWKRERKIHSIFAFNVKLVFQFFRKDLILTASIYHIKAFHLNGSSLKWIDNETNVVKKLFLILNFSSSVSVC